MQVRYDRETDILVITFSQNTIIESDEEKPGMILDYDESGCIVSMEILDASKKVANPEKIEMVNPKGL